MAENSKIEWTDHTFNPWIGCAKVHAGCEHCYAENMMDSRYGKVKWGPAGTRVRTSDANWKKPRQWNRAAEKAGRPALVFCASLADVFEAWGDKPVMSHGGVRLAKSLNSGDVHGCGRDLDKLPVSDHRWATLADVREKLFELVDATPHLIWLMLTKRPGLVRAMWPDGKRRKNVWLGTSPCNQETANKAIPDLLRNSGLVGGTFLSAEPLLGPVNLRSIEFGGTSFDALTKTCCPFWGIGQKGCPDPGCDGPGCNGVGVDWVIVGGESGQGARPMNPQWVRDIRDQCDIARVPFLFKQWGEWAPKSQGFNATGGRDWGCLPIDGEFQPKTTCWNGHDDDGGGEAIVIRVGKSVAGRKIDGHEWSQFPRKFRRAAELTAV